MANASDRSECGATRASTCRGASLAGTQILPFHHQRPSTEYCSRATPL